MSSIMKLVRMESRW